MNMNEMSEVVGLIKKVALEQNYECTSGETKFEVYMDKHNAAAFEIWANNSSGYVQVHQWEDGDGKHGKYGRGVYSIRSYTDAIQFCSILISSASLRARRPSC